MGEIITFSNGSEPYHGYFATSSMGQGPGIIVIQEYWGLVDHIKRVVDRFAEAGFTALAPDLFAGKTTTEPDEAASMLQALNIAETDQILRKAILTLMAHPATDPQDKVGVVGFCMGGQLAMYAAANNPVIKATVNFYGIHPKVNPAYRGLNGPLLGFFAERDHSASPSVVKALDEELTLLQKAHQFTTYPGTDHAFFNDDRPEVYNAEASKDAWEKTIAFFHNELV